MNVAGKHDSATRWWVNGRSADQVSVADRGLQFGDGLFETLRIHRGRPRFASLHWQRLQLGCERLQIAGLDFAALDAQLREFTAGIESGMAKVIVTRGIATQRGYAPGRCGSPTVIVSVTAVLESWPATARCQFSAVVLGENPLLAGLKHLNRLENVLARAGQPSDCDEVLLRCSQGTVVCGSSTNIFAVKSGTLLTPRVDRCGVAGVMRRVVMAEARAAGITISEELLLPQDLLAADALFLTNARVGIWPVARLQQRAFSDNAITAALHERVEALDGSG